MKAAESLQGAEVANADLEERLQRRDWELRDLVAVKDARCGASPPPCGWTWPTGGLGSSPEASAFPRLFQVGFAVASYVLFPLTFASFQDKRLRG